MTILRATTITRAALPLLLLCPALAGCPKPTTGCSTDQDCKGDRVCSDGECVAQRNHGGTHSRERGRAGVGTSTQATPLQRPATPSPLQPNPPAVPQPDPPPLPPPQAPPAAPGELASDGLPVVIPPPGSQLPTLQDWTNDGYPVQVTGVAPLKCEWLRVRCGANRKGILIEVTQNEPLQVRGFTLKGTGVGELQMQVVRGTEYQGTFGWELNGSDTGADLPIRWPANQERPTIMLKEQ